MRPIVRYRCSKPIGDFVFHLPRLIRSAIAWAMMPAALWMGVQAPECECATGEHRFFCPHMLTAGFGTKKSVGSTSAQHLCCQKAATESCSNGVTASNTPGLHTSANGPCNHCQAVPSSTTIVDDRVEAPTIDQTPWLSLSLALDQAPLSFLLASDRLLPASDRLPMTDRVIVLCCLLI